MNISFIVLAVVLFAAGIGVARLQRFVMRKIKIRKNQPRPAGHKNIGVPDRVVRLCIAVGLVVYGVYFQSEIALLFAGYATYEAFAKWCGFYALLGANTCPLE